MVSNGPIEPIITRALIFDINFKSTFVSTGCWREMKELVHNFLVLSQNLDTSPEARTVESKFSIFFEVFWLI